MKSIPIMQTTNIVYSRLPIIGKPTDGRRKFVAIMKTKICTKRRGTVFFSNRSNYTSVQIISVPIIEGQMYSVFDSFE